MSDTEIRLACLECAIGTNQQREAPLARAPKLVEWVRGDERRLACLRLACQSTGVQAKTTERLLIEAQAFLDFIVPKTEMRAAPSVSTSQSTEKKTSRKKES